MCCFTCNFVKCVCSWKANFYVIIDNKDFVFCLNTPMSTTYVNVGTVNFNLRGRVVWKTVFWSGNVKEFYASNSEWALGLNMKVKTTVCMQNMNTNRIRKVKIMYTKHKLITQTELVQMCLVLSFCYFMSALLLFSQFLPSPAVAPIFFFCCWPIFLPAFQKCPKNVFFCMALLFSFL